MPRSVWERAAQRDGLYVYGVRMGRVNITVPDEVIAHARSAGLNVSRVATAALVDELDRLAKISAVDRYLADMERELGPIGPVEHQAAMEWADEVLGAPSQSRQRSA